MDEYGAEISSNLELDHAFRTIQSKLERNKGI